MRLIKLHELALQLNRPGLRWVLTSLLPVVARSSPDGVRRLEYRNGGWEHHFEGISSVEPTPRLRGHHLRDIANRTAWGYLYTPKYGDTVIDVGAGLGDETVYFAMKVGTKGRVISIEAHPIIFGFLARTVELNNFRQVKPLNLAVSDKLGTVSIENNLDHHLGNAILQGGGLDIEASTLDQICQQQGIDRIDFLKMNIEGAEKLAILGMVEMIRRTAVISISCHDFKWSRTGNDFFTTKTAVENFVQDHGFITVPRSSARPELADQVNAYNPDLINVSALNLQP